MDGDSFYCEKGSETYQIGEVLNSMVDMYDLYTCGDLYGEDTLTQEDLSQAIDFAVRSGFLVQHY
jgi:hypothetical protein